MRSFNVGAWRAVIVVILLWFLSILILSNVSQPSSEDSHDLLELRFKKAMQELDLLKHQNEEIKTDLQDLTKQIRVLSSSDYVQSDNDRKPENIPQLQEQLSKAQKLLQNDISHATGNLPDHIPSTQFEIARRQLYKDIQEIEWFYKAQLNDLKKHASLARDFPDVQLRINRIIEDGTDRLRVAKYDFKDLSNLDGLQSWRENEASELSNEIQKELHKLQHPSDCTTARKVVCNLNKGCGYGCQIHHIAYCLIVAYGSKRTLILKSKGWRYNKNGWEDIFMPLSSTCTDPSGSSHAHWPGTDSVQVVDLPIIDTISQRPPYLPLAIPDTFSERIMRLSGNPSAWWVGQILKYILRPQPSTKQMLDTLYENMSFRNPVVGVHIRRTDKVGTEAAYHPLEEYMSHVEEYYKVLQLQKPDVERRVYIASDDPSVIDEAKQKYTNYTVYGDTNIARTASVVTRYTDASLRGIIADIHFLSLSDYLVCTFSSQVCRIAYEIMLSYKVDSAFSFHSLDDVYYYGGQNYHYQKARFSHHPVRSEEMVMEVSDLVSIAGNHWDGFSKGTNRRLRQTALYPSYKVQEVVDVAKTMHTIDS